MFESFAFTSYFIDKNIWNELKKAVEGYEKILIITGEKSFQAVSKKLLKSLLGKDIEIKNYGGECTYENVENIIKTTFHKKFDLVLGVGGGKVIDTSKIVALRLGRELFVIPTIASTCAGTSALSVVYNSDSTFKEFCFFKEPPKKIFIDLETIKNAPQKYLWAGMGDTLAKYYEVRIKYEYSLKMKRDINFHSSMAIKLSELCRDEILQNGEKALYDSEIGEELKKVVLTILVNTGMVSNLIDEFLNGAIAHSVFYGLTILPEIEKEHLHGEVVAFGILVQLLLEKKEKEYKELVDFYTKMKFPVVLTDVVSKENYIQRKAEIIEEILAGPDLIDFDFDMRELENILFL